MKQLYPEHWKVALRCDAFVITRRLAVVLGMTVCVGLISCDLFKTRTPAGPSKESSTRIPPTEPSLVLQNMVSAFHDGNSENYIASFSDASFDFEATSNANKNFSDTFDSWNKSLEQKYFLKIMSELGKNSSVDLIFDSYTPTYYPGSDSSQIQTTYHLTVPLNSGTAKKFRGQALFILRVDQSNYWYYISRWQDIDYYGTTDSTWSDLKGSFAQ